MHVLVSNDDGIHAEGLWVLAGELSKTGQVTVVAPDREQSAIGTAVTLRHPLRVQKVKSAVPGVVAYATDGTPSDSVILALGKLAGDKVDVVVSGINQGSNLGDDVLISGTVGAALQGYFRGFPAVAISAPRDNPRYLDMAARVASIQAARIAVTPLPTRLFLNVNLPDVDPAEIAGVKITRLARKSHINTVEEGNRWHQKCYWLVRERLDDAADENTDIRAVEQGNISITPLYINRADRPPYNILEGLRDEILRQLESTLKTGKAKG